MARSVVWPAPQGGRHRARPLACVWWPAV